MKIAIIDDHKMLLNGIKTLVEKNERVTAVSTFNSAIDFLRTHSDSSYDLIITDVDMPEMTGTELVSVLKDSNRDQKILVLSMHKDHALINALFNLKVNGYLLKDSSPELLNDAIDTILDRGTYMTSEIDAIVNPVEAKDEYSLTNREIQIVQHISNALSNKEIADKCFISESTVKTHRKNIMLKLDLKNTAELVRYAIEKKIS